MIIDSYKPSSIIAKDEALGFAEGVIAQSGLIPKLTPLMLDTSAKKLVIWDGSIGKAVFLNVDELDATSSDVQAPLYKSGSLYASAISWPDNTTDNAKQLAFAGSPISIFL